MALLKRQFKGSSGMVVSLDGLDALVAKLEQFSRIKMKAFREAATAAGKIIRAAMRAEIDAKTGGKRTISVQEMSDKAREQVANGSVNIRRLRTKAEKEGPLTEQELEWLRDRQKQGKPVTSIRPRRQKTIAEDVKLSSFVSKRGTMGVYGRTGSLKKSINYKIWSPKAKATQVKGHKFKRTSSGIVRLIVGPAKILTAAYNEMAGEVQKVNTLRTAHLVEKGHQKVVMGHRTQGRVPAYPFMAPGFAKVRGQASAKARQILIRYISAAASGKAGAA